MYKRKLVLYIAMSLDGYIATKEHSLEWLFECQGEGDNGFSEFYNTIDTILIGRTTYDWIMEQEKGDFPYKGKDCYVFSRTSRENTSFVFFINKDAEVLVKDLKSKPGKDIWVVGGGNLLDTFIKAGLVDEVRVTIAPIILGSGIPLFQESDLQTRLSLCGIERFGQFVEIKYKVIVKRNSF